jgi:DNA helicase-2/ATP-dependent DNA helicase PcrA
MTSGYDDIPFFDEEPTPRPAKREAAPARPAGPSGLAARAMAARDGGRPQASISTA